MGLNDIAIALLKEPFSAGTDGAADLVGRTVKLEGGAIFLCLRGCARIAIDLKEYDLVPNAQVVVFPPRCIIHIYQTSPDFSLSHFGFSDEMFHTVTFRMDAQFLGFLKDNPYYILDPEQAVIVHIFMESQKRIYRDKGNRFRQQIVQNLLQNFLYEVNDKVSHLLEQQQENNGRQEATFKRFVHLIHEHWPIERNVCYYADKLCISTKYLSIICRNATGLPTKTFIDRFVLLNVKQLLQSTDLSIQEIAERLHFPDQSYLGRFFKRHEGVSPKEYRSRN